MPEDPAPTTQTAAEVSTTAPAAPAPQAPWERDGTAFDPARAWSLVENLRTELGSTRTERDSLRSNVETYRQAQLSEQQKLEERAATAERQLAAAQGETLRLRVAAEHGVSAENLALLGQGNEEQLRANAARLAELQAAAAVAGTAAPARAPIPGKPVEQLRPGATPTDSPTPDDELWNQLFGADQKAS